MMASIIQQKYVYDGVGSRLVNLVKGNKMLSIHVAVQYKHTYEQNALISFGIGLYSYMRNDVHWL